MFFDGEAVIVYDREITGYNDLNEAVYDWLEQERLCALVAPSQTQDLKEERPEGIKTTLTLYFPSTYTDSLAHKRIDVRGQMYAVVGDPIAYDQNIVPGAYNRVVEVVRVEG